MSREKKRLGRPITTGIGHPITVRVNRELLLRIDAWRARQHAIKIPTRPEALRQLARRGL